MLYLLGYYTIFSYKIFLRWKEIYKPPYVYLLGSLGLRIYNSPVVFYVFISTFTLFSFMVISILTELSLEKSFAIGILVIFFIETGFFCVSRHYSNKQHINAYPKLLSLFPVSNKKKIILALYGEIIMPNIISVLIIICGIFFISCPLRIKLELLLFIISLHLFLSIISLAIPRKRIIAFSFIIIGAILVAIGIFISSLVFENKIQLELINLTIKNILPFYYILCVGTIILFIYNKLILIKKYE